MKQSNLMSFIESTINILVGFGIACIAQAIFLPMLGVPIPWSANFAFAAIMTVISIGRSFLLRRAFEALHIRRPLSPFMQACIAECLRQREVEGWTAEHDDDHADGSLALAGAAYAELACKRCAYNSPAGDNYPQWPKLGPNDGKPPAWWPWSMEWWKPAGFRRELVKAGALIIAEGEKFDRARKGKRRVEKATA